MSNATDRSDMVGIELVMGFSNREAIIEHNERTVSLWKFIGSSIRV